MLCKLLNKYFMKKVMELLALLTIAAGIWSFDAKPREAIKWMSMKELEAAYKKEPRPILIDLYTKWCGWCKEMDRTTYRNSKVVAYMNQHYYAVKFDAELNADVVFDNKIFKFNKALRAHELALHLSYGQLEFPTTVFLENPAAMPAPLPGFLKAKELEAPLKYFAEADRKGESFIDFNRNFRSQW
ncbi:MAG: DUF255 domain-containing protein [Chitinophagaceae bacterium]|nr:MAG: DUF255 domain-containing protein [Chitinophagaceae bacterium]